MTFFTELGEGMTAPPKRGPENEPRARIRSRYKPAPKVTPERATRVREDLKISRALFAAHILNQCSHAEKLGAGTRQPNAQAALLINLLKRFPDTVHRLATI